MTAQRTSLINKVRDSLLSLVPGGLDNYFVLMVSGGSDSVALLQLLLQLCTDARGGTDNLLVLHVNHQLRGDDALADEHFVKGLCEELGIDYKAERADVASFAKKARASVEQAGRTLRYELAEQARAAFSTQLCMQEPSGKTWCPESYILTAHTAEDRAETLLQRMIVGGGSGSLASIPKRNGFVVRPLLDCSRLELRGWLTDKNVSKQGKLWCEDATNLDTSYSRAFVRHELLPLLAERNPRIVESLNRTAEILTSESTWIDGQAALLLPLTRDSFNAPLPLLRRAVYLACNEAIQELAPEARITFEQVELIAKEGGTPGFACQIPGGIEVRNKRGQLSFIKAKPPQHSPKDEWSTKN